MSNATFFSYSCKPSVLHLLESDSKSHECAGRKLLQRMVSDFETAEPLICSLINIVIPALCLRSTLKSCPPFLPRSPGGRNDTSRLWHGCHSSTIPLPDKLADTAGLPPSLWESVSKFHYHLWGCNTPRVPLWAWRLRRSLGWLLEKHLSWRRNSCTSA